MLPLFLGELGGERDLWSFRAAELFSVTSIERLRLETVWATNGRELPRKETFARLKDALEFREIRNTKLVELGAYATDPAEAANIANTIAVVCREHRIVNWMRPIQRALVKLDEELEQKRKEVEAVTLDLARRRERDGIVDSNPESESANLSLSDKTGGTNAALDGTQKLSSYVVLKITYQQAKRLYEGAQVNLWAERAKIGVPPDLDKIWEKAVPPAVPIRFSLRRLRHGFSR